MTSAEFSYLQSIGYAGSVADKRNAYYNDLLNGAQIARPTATLNVLTGMYHADGFPGIDRTGVTDSSVGWNRQQSILMAQTGLC